MKKYTIAILVAVLVFCCGAYTGVKHRENYVIDVYKKAYEWQHAKELSKYTDEDVIIGFCSISDDGMSVIVGIYPSLSAETEKILRKNFCNMWVEYCETNLFF